MFYNTIKKAITIATLLNSTTTLAQIAEFKSPNGKNEQCLIMRHIPDGKYSNKDLKKESELCSINLYQENIALCPKTWGTSPALLIYPNDKGISNAEYESQYCVEETDVKKIAKLKSSMNDPKTSATYAWSSLIYYHLSRYFDLTLEVPVAVYRTVDKDVHYDRVSSKAIDNGRKNGEAWKIMQKVLPHPAQYASPTELFTKDQEFIYGALLDSGGDKYNSEFNGIRSKWGLPQTLDFMETAAFRALRSELPLKQAIEFGEMTARKNAKMNLDLGAQKINSLQMIIWMKEITEMTLMDYILSQQDRVGNVLYKWHWMWLQEGKLQSRNADLKDIPRNAINVNSPTDIAQYRPVLIQKTKMIDNDAGVRRNYKNFTKVAKQLESIRHFSAKVYRKLLLLNEDLSKQGLIYNYLKTNFQITNEELSLIVGNTQQATSILKNLCKENKLQFDLKIEDFALGKNTIEQVQCD